MALLADRPKHTRQHPDRPSLRVNDERARVVRLRESRAALDHLAHDHGRALDGLERTVGSGAVGAWVPDPRAGADVVHLPGRGTGRPAVLEDLHPLAAAQVVLRL